MYRIGYFAFLFIFPLSLLAQDRLVPLHSNPIVRQAALHSFAGQNKRPQRIMSVGMDTLPFLDDFSKPGPYPDSSKWIDKKVYVNYGNPVCPHTLCVATFDGLDSIGKPYHPGASPYSSDTADFLTSKPISWRKPKTSTITTDTMYQLSDSIYLSFYYQAGTYFGTDSNPTTHIKRSTLGYWPKPTDTLQLQFHAAGDTAWHTVWYHTGYEPIADTDTVFHLVMIPFTAADSVYLYDGFQFRFMNYACGSADADHWSIDGVYLNALRGFADTTQNDIAFVYEAPSMLTNYTAEPWEQYKPGDLRTTPMQIFERNNNASASVSPLNVINATYYYGINIPSDTIEYTGGADNIDPYVDIGYNNNTTQTIVPLIETSHFPTTLTGATTYTITHVLQRPNDFDYWNDTLRFNQVFTNYYAYDDGSPEAAYYIYNTTPSYLAYQFTLNNADTIFGMQIYFDYVFVNDANDYFKMIVWNDNGGTPGDTIYVDTIINPAYNNSGNDMFSQFKFRKPVPVKAGKYYVGWEQTSINDSLNIGFDFNDNNQDKIFFCLDVVTPTPTWYNSSFQGSLMIRPLLGSPSGPAGISNINAPKDEITLYPNPAKNEVHLSGALNNSAVRILGEDGRVLYEDAHFSGNSINTTTLPNGFYLVQITTEKGETTFKKMIISK